MMFSPESEELGYKLVWPHHFLQVIKRMKSKLNIYPVQDVRTTEATHSLSYWIKGKVARSFQVKLKEEPRNRSRPKFRQLSRDVSGEVYDIPEDHQVIFAYETLRGKTVLIGAICFRIADVQLTEPNTEFDSDFYHVIAFLFVKGDFQDQGIGRRLFEKAVTVMLSTTKRPIRVQSAERAVGFFEKMGFVQVKPPSESLCGPRLFRFLYNMEKTVK